MTPMFRWAVIVLFWALDTAVHVAQAHDNTARGLWLAYGVVVVTIVTLVMPSRKDEE